MDESFKDWQIVEGYYVAKGKPSERFTSLAELEKHVRVTRDAKRCEELKVHMKFPHKKAGEDLRKYQRRRRKFLKDKEKCLEEIQ
jgi:hypothetical protein